MFVMPVVNYEGKYTKLTVVHNESGAPSMLQKDLSVFKFVTLQVYMLWSYVIVYIVMACTVMADTPVELVTVEVRRRSIDNAPTRSVQFCFCQEFMKTRILRTDACPDPRQVRDPLYSHGL